MTIPIIVIGFLNRKIILKKIYNALFNGLEFGWQ